MDNKKLQRQIIRRAKKLKAIHQVEVPRAVSSALNKSAKKVVTPVVREVSKGAKVPQKHVRKRTFISRASSRKLRAKVSGYVYPIPLISVIKTKTILSKARRGTNRRGVRAAGRQYDGAFINVHRRSGRFQVFRRKTSRRYPLEVISIDVSKSFRASLEREAPRVMRQDFPKLLLHELKYRTNKYAK